MRLMKRVARTVALKLSESKRFSDINRTVFSGYVGTATFRWAYRNIFATLPVATGALAGSSYAIDGNEIVDPLMKVKAVCQIPFGQIASAAANLAYGTIRVTAYLLASNDYTGPVVGGGPPPGTMGFSGYPTQYSSDDPGWFLNQDGYKTTLNGNNVKVMKKWTKKYHPDIIVNDTDGPYTNVGLGNIVLDLTFKHKFRGKYTFEDNHIGDLDSNYPRAGTLRGWNYYLLVGWAAQGGIAYAQAPQVFMDTFMYFKDP